MNGEFLYLKLYGPGDLAPLIKKYEKLAKPSKPKAKKHDAPAKQDTSDNQ